MRGSSEREERNNAGEVVIGVSVFGLPSMWVLKIIRYKVLFLSKTFYASNLVPAWLFKIIDMQRGPAQLGAEDNLLLVCSKDLSVKSACKQREYKCTLPTRAIQFAIWLLQACCPSPLALSPSGSAWILPISSFIPCSFFFIYVVCVMCQRSKTHQGVSWWSGGGHERPACLDEGLV